MSTEKYDSSMIWKQQAIGRAHSKYPCTNHPLIVAIESGNFDAEQIQTICCQIYHVVKNFPRFLSAIATNMENTIDRMPIVENLFEEHGRMNERHIHINTFIEFCSALGLSSVELEKSEPIEGVTVYIRSVLDLCLHYSVKEGLAALGIIEEIVHQVSPIIGRAAIHLRPDIERVSHFTEHEILDDQHSKEIYELINCDSEDEKILVQRGLKIGSYLHYRLYSDIFDYATSTDAVYPLDDGQTADERLAILNRLYNPGSLSFISEHINDETKSVLEIGCGSGELAAMLAKSINGRKLVAIDQGAQNIKIAKSNYAHLKIEFRQQPWQQLGDEKFDLIYMRWVAIYQSDLLGMISKLSDHLCENGILIIEDNNPEDSGVDCLPASEFVDAWKDLWSQQTRSICKAGNLDRFIKQVATDCRLLLLKSSHQQSDLKGADKGYMKLSVIAATSHLLENGYKMESIEGLIRGLGDLCEKSVQIPFVKNFQTSYSKTRN